MTTPAWERAAELDPYRDEPPQMASGRVGKDGFLRLGFERRQGRSVLADLRRRTPLFAHKALYWDTEMPGLPCVFLITTTGCVLQGDRLRMEVDLGPGAQAHLTTQSGTQIHSMDANYAAQAQEITLADEAYLELLPDPIYPHARSRFLTTTVVRASPTATLLYSEILMPGRKHHGAGESFRYHLFSSTLRVERPDGREVFTERFLVEPGGGGLRAAARMGGFEVFGNVLLLTPKAHAEAVLARTAAEFDREVGVAAGASRLPHEAGLVYKVLARESAPVRERVRRFWGAVREAVVGRPLMPEFLWR